MAEVIIKRYLPALITAATGVAFLINNFTGELKLVTDELKLLALVVVWVSLYYSSSTMVLSLGREVKNRRRYWHGAVWGLILFAICYGAGFAYQFNIGDPNIQWIINHTTVASNLGIYAATAVIVMLAIIRRLRTGSLEGAVIVITAIFTIFYQSTMFTSLWPGFKTIGDFITKTITVFAQRGLLLAAAFGGVSIALRTLLGMEKGIMGRD